MKRAFIQCLAFVSKRTIVRESTLRAYVKISKVVKTPKTAQRDTLGCVEGFPLNISAALGENVLTTIKII